MGRTSSFHANLPAAKCLTFAVKLLVAHDNTWYAVLGDQVIMKLIFEWDENKARSNLKKHKVSFDEAKTLFSDPFLITFPDEYHSDSEERLISTGCSARGRILLVVHSERREADNVILRIISCRKATPQERRTYEEDEE